MKSKALWVGILVSILFVSCIKAQLNDFPILTGPYFGQEPPGMSPELFVPDVLVKSKQAHSNVIFAEDGTQVYWCHNGIWFSKLNNGKWTIPRMVPFSKEEFSDDAPFLSVDETLLFFASKRPTAASDTTRKENLWVVNIGENGWSDPRLLPSTVNNFFQHWQASVDCEGTLYFGHRSTTAEDRDIYFVRYENETYQEPQPLGSMINTEHNEGNPFIERRGEYILFSRRNDQPLPNGGQDVSLFVSFRLKDGSWSQAVNLKEHLRFQNSANCPFVTPDNKYLFFLDLHNGKYQRYWISARIIDNAKAAHPQSADFR